MSEPVTMKFDGLASREWLIYRYPAEIISLGSVLAVQENQTVVFVYDGQVTDTFIEGNYVLSQNNLPIIDSFENFSRSGKTAFEAKLYFINLKTKLDILWGTPEPITLTDSACHLRAYGFLNLKITDIPLFLRETLKATGNNAVKYKNTVDFYKSMLNLHLKKLLPAVIREKNIPLQDIAIQVYDISQEVCRKITPVFENCGLDIMDFRIQAMSFPDEEKNHF